MVKLATIYIEVRAEVRRTTAGNQSRFERPAAKTLAALLNKFTLSSDKDEEKFSFRIRFRWI